MDDNRYPSFANRAVDDSVPRDADNTLFPDDLSTPFLRPSAPHERREWKREVARQVEAKHYSPITYRTQNYTDLGGSSGSGRLASLAIAGLGALTGKSVSDRTRDSSSRGRRDSLDTDDSEVSLPPTLEEVTEYNFPPVLTDLGKWQNRKAKLWTELNPTISKDRTMGEAAHRGQILAGFAKGHRHCRFGVRLEVQTPEEEEKKEDLYKKYIHQGA
jgi:hypothetical protein